MPGHDPPHDEHPVGAPACATDGSDPTTDLPGPASDPASPPRATAPGSPSPPPAVRYELLAEIARGGMGAIWRATDTTLSRELAVKVLQGDFAPGSRIARRFADEARITAQLQHPAIPPVHDSGTLPDGRPFLAMKLIKGRTLEDLLRGRPDPAAERGRFVAVFEQVCQALAYAHAHQVIHRDLKPANVMVGAFGEVQVMDWGLAKVLTGTAGPTDLDFELGMSVREILDPDAADADPGETMGGTIIRGSDDDGSDASFTQAGSVLGTPAYMAPEQAAGVVDQVGPRSDVFGLGAILAVILTGRPPYAGPNSGTIRLMAVRGEQAECLTRLAACEAEPELVALCKRCLAFDPADRPRDAGAVAEEVAGLRAAAEERALAAEKERAAAEVRVAEQKRRRRLQRAVAVAVIVILALVGGGAWWIDHQASLRATERAVAAERDRLESAAALAKAEGALSAGDLATAELALSLAEKRLVADGPADLRGGLAAAKRDRDLVRALREIEDLSWSPGDISMPDKADMSARYRAVFARYGLDPGVGPDAAAEAVRASRVSAALVAGLGEWFCTDPERPHLRQLLDRLDPDPGRAAIREAIQAGGEARVRELVGALDGSTVPAWFAASVGYHRLVPFEDGVRLMAAAWRTHPADYLLAYRIALRLWGTSDDRLPEMLTWARVAVALRPDSPYPHNLLSTAWRGLRNWGEAEACSRRAIELGQEYPKYAAAHVGLGNLMLAKGDLDAAEASYRAAIAIDPDSPAIYFNLGLVYRNRHDLAGAEPWFRKAVEMAPSRAYFREVLDTVIQERARPDQ